MDNFVDIVFEGKDPVKDLSRLLSMFRYSLTYIPWLTNRKPGEYRLGPVPLIVFDAWAKSNPQYPHGIQFENETVVVTVVQLPHDGAAGIIAQHIVLNAHGMCQPKDAKIWSHTGRTTPHLALKFLTISHNTFKRCSQEWGRSSIFTSIRQGDRQTRYRNRNWILRFRSEITKRHRIMAQQ